MKTSHNEASYATIYGGGAYRITISPSIDVEGMTDFSYKGDLDDNELRISFDDEMISNIIANMIRRKRDIDNARENTCEDCDPSFSCFSASDVPCRKKPRNEK